MSSTTAFLFLIMCLIIAVLVIQIKTNIQVSQADKLIDQKSIEDISKSVIASSNSDN